MTLTYHNPPRIDLDFKVTGPDGEGSGHRVELGIPHLVFQVDALPTEAIEPSCRPLRYAPELGERGANIHLVQVAGRNRIRIRSYERGVEEETLACGSGSMSSAVALAAAGQVEPPVEVETRSGDILIIRFRREGDNFSELELEGPARIIYRGELSLAELPGID